jgi:hypothetical protein
MAYFGLTGDVPPAACANCGDQRSLGIVPYFAEKPGPMLAVLVLCNLCLLALNHNELGCRIDLRVAGQEGWKVDSG